MKVQNLAGSSFQVKPKCSDSCQNDERWEIWIAAHLIHFLL